jgi:hypothetical protein
MVKPPPEGVAQLQFVPSNCNTCPAEQPVFSTWIELPLISSPEPAAAV